MRELGAPFLPSHSCKPVPGGRRPRQRRADLHFPEAQPHPRDTEKTGSQREPELTPAEAPAAPSQQVPTAPPPEVCHCPPGGCSQRWGLPAVPGQSLLLLLFFSQCFSMYCRLAFFLKTTNYSMPVWLRAQSREVIYLTSHGCFVAGMKSEFQFLNSQPPSLPSAELRPCPPKPCLTVEAPSNSDTLQTQAGNAKCCAWGHREQRHRNPELGHLVQS